MQLLTLQLTQWAWEASFGTQMAMFLLRFIVFFCNITSPLLAKALALRKLMMVCWELQLPKVLLEGDCLQVVFAANNNSPPDSDFCSILFDIQFLMHLGPN